MSSLKKINKKITILILLNIGFLLLVNGIFLRSISENIASDFFNATSDDIFKDLEQVVNSLKESSVQVSENEDIISILNNNKSLDSLSDLEIEDMFGEIELSESLIRTLNFVNTINIASVDGEYMFSQNEVHDNFILSERPWFQKESYHKNREPQIVDIHKDFTTGKHTTSIVSYIVDENNKLIGATILDIYLDDLLDYIKNRYNIDGLEPYMIINNKLYPNNDIKENNNLLSVRSDSLLLSFDKNASLPIKSLNIFLDVILLLYCIICVVLIYSLSTLLQKLMEPITNCLNKFKEIIANSDKDLSTLSKQSEIEQLEIVSGILSKSFDDKVKQLIYYDELTNLPNKKSLISITDELINVVKPFSLIFIDLIELRAISDLFGYKFADQFIKEFATELSTVSNEDIIVTRYSDSKFIILLKNYTTDEDIKRFYNMHILSKLNNKKFVNDSIRADVSASVCVYPKQGFTLDKLLQKNTFILDINKKGRSNNELLFFDDKTYKKVHRSESIKVNLRKALENNEFKILYQPIMNKDESVQKLEALIRWQNKRLGFVPPDEFIKYAEEIGEIIPIGYWIFEEVCRNYKHISQNSKTPIQISVNVSPIQLLDDCFFENVLSILNKHMVDSKNICIEVTESVLMESSTSLSKNLLNLRRFGFDIALDDFGTGYSSFSYLKQFNFSILKIDKIFIDDDNESDYKIVSSIRDIAKELGINVVVEGVETKHQLDSLKNAKCDFFQGYYFSKPLPLDELLLYLSSFK